MKNNRISDRELDIMHVFWEKGEPLIASEIVSANPELKISTVQISLKKLIEKGYVQVSDIVYSGKVLSRKYEAIKSPNEYIMDEAQAAVPGFRKGIFSSSAFSALLNGEQNEESLLEELEELVNQRKKELK